MNRLIVTPALLPAPLFAPTPKAVKRVLEFFTAQINNDHTCKAYPAATRHFADCPSLAIFFENGVSDKRSGEANSEELAK